MDRKSPPRGMKPVQSSEALAIGYRRRLKEIVRGVAKEIQTDVLSIYRHWRSRDEQNAAIVEEVSHAFGSLRERWKRDADIHSRRTASAFVGQVDGNVQFTFNRLIRSIGVREEDLDKPTRLAGVKYETSLQAAIAENVSLITSIPGEYLDKVQRDVLLAVQGGWPLDELSQALQHQYGVAQNRADLIARDQCAKITGKMNQQRMLSVGFKEADWWHSAGSRYPRKSHQQANGKRFLIAEGCYIDHENILPGQKICCKCFMTPVIPGR